jgi:WD40 repeat protein
MFKPISLFFFPIIILFTINALGAMEVKLSNPQRGLGTVASTSRGGAKPSARATRRRVLVAVLGGTLARELIDLIMQYDDAAFRGSCVNTVETKEAASALASLSDDIVAVGSETGYIRIVRLKEQAGCVLQVLDGQDGDIVRYPICLLLPIHSTCFISVSDLGIIKYWQNQRAGYQCIQTWKSNDLGQVTAMMRLPKDRLWVGLVNGEMKMWTPTKSECIEAVPLEGHRLMVVALGKLSDGRLVSASVYDMKIWGSDNNNDAYRSLQTIPSTGGDITAMVVLPGDRIATGARDKTIQIWGERSRDGFVCAQTINGHISAIRALAVVCDDQLVSIAEDGCMKLWDDGDGLYRSLKTIGASFLCLAPTSDGVIATDKAGCLYVVD